MDRMEMIKKQFTIQNMIDELQILIDAVKEDRQNHDGDSEQFHWKMYCTSKWFAERITGKKITVREWKVVAE